MRCVVCGRILKGEEFAVDQLHHGPQADRFLPRHGSVVVLGGKSCVRPAGMTSIIDDNARPKLARPKIKLLLAVGLCVLIRRGKTVSKLKD